MAYAVTGTSFPVHPENRLSKTRLETLTDQFSSEPAYRHIGMTLLQLSYGKCITQARIEPWPLHHRGAVQGGVIAMSADATAGYSALATIQDDADSGDMATLEFKTSFYEPAMGQHMRCEAATMRASRHIIFCRAQVWSCSLGESEVLCAEGTLTFKRMG